MQALTLSTLEGLITPVALLAMLAPIYGRIMRIGENPVWGRALLGALFGVGSLVAMFHVPLILGPGSQADLRNLPVALAAGFLGGAGGAAAALIAVLGRLAIGGAGAVPGILGIGFAMFLGLIWWARTRSQDRRGLKDLLILAALTSLSTCCVLLLPRGFLAPTSNALLATLPLHIVGTLVVGAFLERERALLARERALEDDAEHDPLTGLLNRRGLAAALERSPLEGGCCVILIDLDHFKDINDSHGHEAGDRVLVAVARRLSSSVREGSLVARLGGDEIAIILPDVDGDDVDLVVRRLQRAIHDPYVALRHGVSIPVTATLSLARSPGDESVQTLLQRADEALLAAKAQGGGRVVSCGQRAGTDHVMSDRLPARRRARPSPAPL